MRLTGPGVIGVSLVCAASALLAASGWSRFRGPNGTGVADGASLPSKFGPTENVDWKTALPPGQSSPVLSPNSIFLTAYEDEKLFVISVNKASGRIEWRREVLRDRKQELHKSNTPASPSAVTDGRNVYAFFTDFGLISFGPDGNERWRLPLGPFNNPFGMGASPVLHGDTLLQSCDSESGSFFVAVNKETGKVKWRVERPEYTRGFSTPVIWEPAGEAAQVLIAGSYQLTAYAIATGKPVWWVRGLTWQLKPTPAMAGDRLFLLGWAGGSDTGQQEDIAAFDEVVKIHDKNADRKLSADEINDEKVRRGFKEIDLDRDGVIGDRDWEKYRSRRAAVNAIMAIKLGGQGDMTEKNVLWKHYRSLPNVPSPLFYRGVVYLMKEGGILTSFDARTGEVAKRARLEGALDQYFTSPVAGDGKVYVISESGQLTVLKAGLVWEILSRSDFGEPCYATPAIENGRIYLRTNTKLYCFREKNSATLSGQ